MTQSNWFFMDTNTILYGLTTIYLVNLLVKYLKRTWKLPPGPWGLPIVGYYPFIGKNFHYQFTDLYKKYGSVFSLKVGSYDVIMVNGWPAIKEALANDNLLARPHKNFFSIIQDSSFIEMSGNDWRDQRRVALTTLRNVGLGKTKMEDGIRDEIDCFIGQLKSKSNESIIFNNIIARSLPNNISILLFGHKFDYDDPKKIKLETVLKSLNSSVTIFDSMFFMPWLTKFKVRWNGSLEQNTVKQFESGHQVILEEINQHKEKLPSDDIDDYIDGFHAEMAKRSCDKTFHEKTLIRNSFAFYGAGSDTLRVTLDWAFQILAAYPEIQMNLRKDILKVIGTDRSPENTHRQLMPYTMAFIYEILRFSSIVPLNIPRRAIRDTSIAGKTIPEDALVFLNFWSVHRDPKLYPDPEKFDPTRFLNEDQSAAVKPSYLIAFSGGRRACPGESLAYLELFLYLVSIVRKFEIKPEPGVKVSLEAEFISIRSPANAVKLIFNEIE